MDASVGGENPYLFAAGPSNSNGIGKSLEWDLNDWRWDGELFLATRLNPETSVCRSKQLFNPRVSNSLSSCSGDWNVGILSNGNGEAEKRRREVEDGALALRLGGNSCAAAEADLVNLEGKNGKRLKSQGAGSTSNRSVCQVEGCRADLTTCRDYHRRHKVCQMHAKASMAMVGNAMQRFCQQCSRFHLLQEFDEGKRSCRRRLAGHNKRRRKTHPDASATGNMLDGQAGACLLISLLRILSNAQSGSSSQSKDQELFSHLLKILASAAGSIDLRKLSELLEASQDLNKDPTSDGVPVQDPLASGENACIGGVEGTSITAIRSGAAAIVDFDMHPRTTMELSAVLHTGSPISGVGLKNFDLNNTYDNDEDFRGCEKSITPHDGGSSWAMPDSHQTSPPQTSDNSDTTSPQSLSNNSGNAQARTDKIVFKLFGKDPNDFPLILRSQILDWLSHSPTDIESYIRPGCIILTIFLRQTESSWEELVNHLSTSLTRLLNMPGDDFWRRGMLYARIQHQAAFVLNGQVILNVPLLPRAPDYCKIVYVTPVAVSVSTRVSFTVKGFNLTGSATSLLCAFEGGYLLQETTQALIEDFVADGEHKGLQSLSFSCLIPDTIGRGFIEIEDTSFTSSFFPFIVAEEDVCTEIRMLEYAFSSVPVNEDSDEELESMNARDRALDFLHEIGWLLRRSWLRSVEGTQVSYDHIFPLTRFIWLLAYAMDREWRAVVKKLLDILFEETVELGGHSPAEVAQSELLLHNAARMNSRSLVEFLLRYIPSRTNMEKGDSAALFTPDMVGPLGITPLHIAAAGMSSENVLDALTDDPGLIGLKAWKDARDSTGLTPLDYARLRGYESYIQLVQEKVDKQLGNAQVVLDIPASFIPSNTTSEQVKSSMKLSGFEVTMNKPKPIKLSSCRLCTQQLTRHPYGIQLFSYRPAMLSLIGIAAVCVCVGLLLKSPPNVICLHHPFVWEKLGIGTM